MPNKRILIVDDEEFTLLSLKSQLQQLGYEVFSAASGEEALLLLESQAVELVITDLVMPTIDGALFMQAVHESRPSLPFIVMTAKGSIENAVETIRKGAIDYLEKPINPLTFDLVVRRALEFGRLSCENEQLRKNYGESFSFQDIITQSPTMRTVLELAARVAASPRSTISLYGESGVGKEVLARAIHSAAGRIPGKFVAVNCAAIPETLLESELFGHVRGAFTGADRDKEGKFGLARGGTMLLDEIGDMPLSLQAKLLRVLEEKTFEKVGSSKPLAADFRVIVATHHNLAERVRNGTFREDLFHRINVVPISIPPLRERREDIPLLVEHFIGFFRKHLGKTLPGLSKKAMDQLVAYDWPGNIRELRNVLEYASIVVSDELIRPEHLRLPMAKTLPGNASKDIIEYCVALSPEEISLDAITGIILDRTLRNCGGNKTKAAQILKVNRKIFYR
ncbi:sigma-54 dependent transcriptional regulator [Geobacter pelophilus]|uniref:Sigma-54 dependent transcriptional regulator n=1 Tax=Geoanaerobacter pelophilus TaxID=60036 RepID=A0AAW4L6I4_9BACT|nr:sigma-54 dependent transcriptional regulator [Geoanaerobacter pelophilus]MBT0666508.1 sigma-54 dependent transcriptional regulator [Geoanaerobacter pelophilus]